MAAKKNGLTATQIIELAKADPKLAEQIYYDKKAGEAYEAFAKFQEKLTDVPETQTVRVFNKRKRRYVTMYHYARYIDLKHTVDKAIKGTGLSIMQIPGKSETLHLPVLDKYGKPVKDKKTRKLVVTLGMRLSETTIIFYKNGYRFPNSYETTVAQTTSPQDIGTAATYAKRYSLAQAIGAASSPDRDGFQSAGGSRVIGRQTQQAPQRRAPQFPSISPSQVKKLNQEITKAATATGVDKTKITAYVGSQYSSDNNISDIPKNKFIMALKFLKKEVNAHANG